MIRPPIIYLDTQDYSRFGDVLRGKGNLETEALFAQLCQMRRDGKAIFASSMPILAELLQYDVHFRETTIKKAEAVENLCGTWALAYPPTIVAAEVAQFAGRRGYFVGEQSPIANDERRWFPDIDDVFENLRAQMTGAVESELKSLNLPRKERRRVKTKFRRIDIVKVARDAAPLMAAEFGLPVSAFENSIIALLQGKITARQASRRLFGAIAEPVKFVEIYFEKVKNDGSLPAWMSQFGANFEAKFKELRTKVEQLRSTGFALKELDRLFDELPEKLGRSILAMAEDEAGQFGIDRTMFKTLATDPGIARETPSAVIVGGVVAGYMRQVIGLNGDPAQIESSFGGDLVHALYLPHVDFWRGDRRFSALLMKTVPQFASRIIARPRDLPGAIDQWWQRASE